MKFSDFDFELPEALLATRPVRPRSAARLLVAEGAATLHAHVHDLPNHLRPGDRLILNDTKVIPARLMGVRKRKGAGGETEAAVELTLLEPGADGTWSALMKPMKKIRDGEVLEFDGLSARVLSREGGLARVAFDATGDAFDAALERAGHMPLPPYIAKKRAADARDRADYQTIWAERRGAVAAPTASLHFDAPLMEALEARGVTHSHVTLHVGAGTFLPVRTDTVDDHKMHAEWGEVTPEAAAQIRQTQAEGGRIIPVGTTALRILETAAQTGAVNAFTGETDIFIKPGYRFQATDGLMTNFHLPRSTLLMLVSALMGQDRVREVYATAIAEAYRFFSYGDASLLIPENKYDP
jgi:S-adenosylmethionine:tRNA ribosyltransferase-isomerase